MNTSPLMHYHYHTYKVNTKSLFINCGSSSGHFMPVLAGKIKTTIVLVDEKNVENPALQIGASSTNWAQESRFYLRTKIDTDSKM
jgi:hypothetical protein